jgi:ankyrin repeat protein
MVDRFQKSLQLVVDRLLNSNDSNTIWRDQERRAKYDERTKYNRRKQMKLPPILSNSSTAEERIIAIEDHSATYPHLKVASMDSSRIESLIESGLLFCSMPTHNIYNDIQKENDKIDARNHHQMFEELPFEDSQLLINLERELNKRMDTNKDEELLLEKHFHIDDLIDDNDGDGCDDDNGDGNGDDDDNDDGNMYHDENGSSTRCTTTKNKKRDINLQFGSRRCIDIWSLVLSNDCFGVMHLLDHDYVNHKDINSPDFRVPNGKGRTPLHNACNIGDSHICLALLLRAAKCNSVDDDQYTPMDLAIINGHRKCVELLLSFGTPTNINTNCYPALSLKNQNQRKFSRISSCLNVIDRCIEYDLLKVLERKKTEEIGGELEDREKQSLLTIKGEEEHRAIYNNIIRPRIGQVYIGTWRVIKQNEEKEEKEQKQDKKNITEKTKEQKQEQNQTKEQETKRVPHTDENEFGALYLKSSVIIGSFHNGCPIFGTEFCLTDGQTLYHGNYNESSTVPIRDGRGTEIITVHPSIGKEEIDIIQEEKQKRKKEKKEKENNENESIDWYRLLRKKDISITYKYDGYFQNNIWNGKGKLFVYCKLPIIHSLGTTTTKIIHKYCWRPYYIGTFKMCAFNDTNGNLWNIQFHTLIQESNQLKYRGTFVSGEMTGEGIKYYYDQKCKPWLESKNGIGCHKGLFKNGLPHGYGKSYYKKNSNEETLLFIEGTFYNGYVSGKQSTIYSKDQSIIYNGTTLHGKPYLHGIRYWKHSVYDGEFDKNGKPHGRGTVRTKNGIFIQNGVFLNGCISRPIMLHEWNNGSDDDKKEDTKKKHMNANEIFYIVAKGGKTLTKHLISSSTFFKKVNTLRTHNILGYKTALHVAVEAGNLGSVMSLIECGACNPFLKDYLGRTSKDLAKLYNKRNITELLTMLESINLKKKV